MARQEKSLAVCLEILQDYTAKDFSLFAVLTTADFYSHNSQFHFLSHNPNDMKQWHATLERHLKRNDQCDRKTQKKCRKRERQKGEETRTSLQFLEPQINLIQGYMTTNINITQTWWRLEELIILI